jgi:hypothetical protein
MQIQKEQGFIRIITIVLIVIGILIFSGVNIRDDFSRASLQEKTTELKLEANQIYQRHLRGPLDQYVITPAASAWSAIKIYVLQPFKETLTLRPVGSSSQPDFTVIMTREYRIS